MSAKKIIIFDFDGTLADSAPIIRAIYAEMADKNRLTVMTDEDYAMLRRGSLSEAKKWSGVRFWQFPFLVWNVRRLMKLESEKVNLFPGVIEMIHALKTKYPDMYILSRNTPDTINRVLERFKLQDDLQVLRRHKRSFGSKAAVINRLIEQNNFDRKMVWMVGDEVRDVQAAKKAGVNSIAVAWGLQDTSILEKYEPTYLVNTVEELHSILKADSTKE